jgi:hypothetical protein
MDEADLRLKILNDSLVLCSDTYKENARIATVLEDKAQKTGAIAGLFLAAAFGFAKRDNLSDIIALAGNYGILLMVLCVLLFLMCVFTCLRVLWVHPSSGPPHPEHVFGVVNALLALGVPLAGGVSENHLRDQISAWLPALATQQNVNSMKAGRLLVGQKILAAGMGVLVIVLILLTTNVSEAHRSGAQDRSSDAVHHLWR